MTSKGISRVKDCIDGLKEGNIDGSTVRIHVRSPQNHTHDNEKFFLDKGIRTLTRESETKVR